MIEPTEADVGRRVLYRARRASTDRDTLVVERGVITKLTDDPRRVFVRYGEAIDAALTECDSLNWEDLDGK